VSAPSDPADALRWALNHGGDFWWVWGAIAAGIAWTSKRMRDWSRRNADPAALAARAKARAALMAALSPAAAARPAAAAQPASAAPPQQAAPVARQPYRQAAPAQRAATPVARSVNVPAGGAAAPAGAWTLTGAFGDPAHARTAIVLAEVLGPPLALR
jgi:hypothetical protein